ncbi:MAG TPA: bifunctional phosphoribosylaminoimidazolecarboxamide formyltransferase/IMP cyclohydrolase [Pyrinomonadaceae bacterium]|nr:bifunctional phosphoribosylaminoimidazolecarboxamide formyltransferase/IMP cyclohydrolase [Pyrinomonadaceae bacterium]
MTQFRKIKRALLSLSDKTGAVDFAKALAGFGVQIISTGGTANGLREAGLEVTDVSEVTGFPEMMNGRVKTLHPKIHGAFLALRDNPGHVASMAEHGIEPIDMVVVNLYPFEETTAKADVSLEEAVENIDIGGPAMIRSASKNWRDVAVVTTPESYATLIAEMQANDGSLSLETRQRLAVMAYTRTAEYDKVISSYLARQLSAGGSLSKGGDAHPERVIEETSITFDTPYFSKHIGVELEKAADLRYGENPHQKGALYLNSLNGGVAHAEQLNGKEMSFNNYVDAEAAWNLVNDLAERAVAIIKHTNPSGVGTGATNEEAYRRALSTDPVSAFGGIVAFNHSVDAEVARLVIEVFSEVIVAPDYDQDALEVFRAKPNLRVLRAKEPVYNPLGRRLEFKQLTGGFLVQDQDVHQLQLGDLKTVSKRLPSDAELRSMLLAWRVCKHVKSNAIVLANEHQTVGVGSGQMNRVDSVRIAAMRAERFDLPIRGCALASDAFFPFRDNVDEAAKMGVSAIIQPGGSIKDADSIAAADEHGLTMAFTGFRHFKH